MINSSELLMFEKRPEKQSHITWNYETSMLSNIPMDVWRCFCLQCNSRLTWAIGLFSRCQINLTNQILEIVVPTPTQPKLNSTLPDKSWVWHEKDFAHSPPTTNHKLNVSNISYVTKLYRQVSGNNNNTNISNSNNNKNKSKRPN